MIEQDCKGEKVAVSSKYAGAFDHWQRIKKQYDIKPIDTERTVCNSELGYAGTYDLLAEFEGKKCIIDIKTGNNYPVTAGWQMMAYAKALEQEGVHKDLGVVGIHIKRDGSYGKAWIYQHYDFCWKAFVATWFAWKGMYFNELKRMGWKWLHIDPLEINNGKSEDDRCANLG